MIDMVAEKKLPKSSHDLPLTPMIDVVFLLIIFFVSLKFRRLAGELEARLPRIAGAVNRIRPEDAALSNYIWVKVVPLAHGEAGDVSEDVQPVIITVNGPKNDVGDFDGLQYELTSKRLQLELDGKSPIVVLELDPRLIYQNVVWTINAAKKADFANISFTPPAGTPKD